MNENELSLALRVVVSLSVAHPRDDGDADVDDGRARMRVARSSYFAWVSRGFWPKKPKAHGAAVDVGNKEKGAELDEDISGVVTCCLTCVKSCVSRTGLALFSFSDA